MKKLAIFACLAIGAIAIWQLALPSATVRYRLTLEAQVDGRPRTGSGVIEVSYSKKPNLLPNEAEFSINVRGEAVALDLGDRGTLFALLRSDADPRSSAEWIVLRAFKLPGGALPSPVSKGIGDVRKLAGKVDLPLGSLPLLIRFRDVSDPKTVERVDPFDLGKSFGAGAKLMRASLEIVPAGIWPFSWYGITGERITVGIDQRLEWLGGLKGGYLDGAFTGGGPNLSNILSGANFKTGI